MVAGNGFYVFQIFDDHSSNIPLLSIGLIECIAVAWVYGNDRWAFLFIYIVKSWPGAVAKNPQIWKKCNSGASSIPELLVQTLEWKFQIASAHVISHLLFKLNVLLYIFQYRFSWIYNPKLYVTRHLLTLLFKHAGLFWKANLW